MQKPYFVAPRITLQDRVNEIANQVRVSILLMSCFPMKMPLDPEAQALLTLTHNFIINLHYIESQSCLKFQHQISKNPCPVSNALIISGLTEFFIFRKI